jgi:hypothetical protein
MELKNKRFVFFIQALLFLLINLSFDLLDRAVGLKGYLYIVSKIILIAFLISLLNKKGEKHFSKFNVKYLVFVAISFILTFLMCYSESDFKGKYFDFALNLLFIIISILLEDLFFRSYAYSFFEENGVISLSNSLYVIVIFTICNLPIFFFETASLSVLSIIFLFALDTYVFGIFLSSKNLLICVVCSFFVLATKTYFSFYSVSGILISNTLLYVIYVLAIFVFFSIGAIFIMRNTVRK